MRVNINMSEDLVQKIDKKAKALYLSRSAYISMAVSQKLQADELMENLPVLMQQQQELINKVKSTDKSKE